MSQKIGYIIIQKLIDNDRKPLEIFIGKFKKYYNNQINSFNFSKDIIFMKILSHLESVEITAEIKSFDNFIEEGEETFRLLDFILDQ